MSRAARHIVAYQRPDRPWPPLYLTKRGTFRADPEKAMRFPGWRAAWDAARTTSHRDHPRVCVLTLPRY